MKHNNTHNINSWVIVLGPSKVFKRKTPLEEPYDGKCYSFPKCDLDNLSTFCDGLSMEFKCYAQSHMHVTARGISSRYPDLPKSPNQGIYLKL